MENQNKSVGYLYSSWAVLNKGNYHTKLSLPFYKDNDHQALCLHQ